MVENFLRDVEIALSMKLPDEYRETAMQCIISKLKDYDVVEKTTDIVVRSDAVNEQLVKKYVACLYINGRSKGTVNQYTWTLKKLNDALNMPYTEMKPYDIRFFLGTLKERGTKSNYLESQRAYISAFFKWLTEEEIIEKNPCDRINPIKTPKEIRMPFSSVEIDKLRSACRRPLERAFLEVAISSGLRREEMCNLKISDVDLGSRTILVRDGKGGKDRVDYMSDVAAEYIRKYWTSRKQESEYVFATKAGNHKMGKAGIYYLMKRLGERAGVDNVHPHRFRRTFASDLYKRGMDIYTISKLMGHSSIETTRTYITVMDDQLANDYKRFTS